MSFSLRPCTPPSSLITRKYVEAPSTVCVPRNWEGPSRAEHEPIVTSLSVTPGVPCARTVPAVNPRPRIPQHRGSRTALLARIINDTLLQDAPKNGFIFIFSSCRPQFESNKRFRPIEWDP